MNCLMPVITMQKQKVIIQNDRQFQKLLIHCLGVGQVVVRFDGSETIGNAGGVLLPEVEPRTRVLGRLATTSTINASGTGSSIPSKC